MAPRRHRSTSNAANVYSDDAQISHTQRTQSPASQLQAQRQLGLTPVIYENNLKVLRRREPSIVSIFDQFSHVCVYHYHANKWEKQGYEGSMFLFEKQTYPSYGFFILNRVGTDDYIRPIYPEDDVGIVGDYLAFRYYPTFTRVRLAMGLPYPVPPEHRTRLDAVLISQLTPEEVATSREESASTSKKEWKGTSVTIGLWMFATDAREPLKDVMMRLHSYIKEGKVYPKEFRYGPGRPPPPNPHLRTASRASVTSVAQSTDEQGVQVSNGAASPANGPGSELDKLFAKLIPSASSTPVPDAPPAPAPTASRRMSVQDLFSALGGRQLVQPTPPPVPPPSAPTPNRGLALLDSIFASAAPAQAPAQIWPSSTPQAPPVVHSSSLPVHPEDIQIVSPKPTSSALPQILNQDVIASLLGLDSHSRASSAAPSSAGSRHSRSHRYEGDTEYSESELASASDYSATSTALDVDPAILAVGSAAVPSLAVQHSDEVTTTTKPSIGVQGDVTPRQTARGIGPFSPPLQPQRSTSRSSNQQYLAPSLAARPPANGYPNGLTQSDSLSTVTAAKPTPQRPQSQPRELVPFSADSELWPYPRAPFDDRSQESVDIVELDFADTRALSDPVMFSSRLKEKQGRGQGRQEKKKKTREERAAERERKREEIERGWDDPVKGEVTAGVRPPSTAPGPSDTAKGKRKERAVNGAAKVMPVASGHGSAEGVTSGGVRIKGARDAVIGAVTSRTKEMGSELPKNEFVRELLTLIHTDKDFVDRLYQDYLGYHAK